MITRRRTFIGRSVLGALALTLGLVAGLAAAQSPARINILVGFPPGGGTDAIARILGERLKDKLGVPVTVENKAGAGGQIAAQALKAAHPDGTTIFLSHDHTISILPMLVKNPGFDPARDFVPVAGFATFVNAFAVSAGTPARTLAEYVSWVRTTRGGKGAVGIPAPASTPEFLVKVVGDRYKLDLVAAPYKGSAPMMADMLGNQIPAGIGSVSDFIENHRAGKIRVVAVLGKPRQAALPDVPSFAELGVDGLEDTPYYGLFAPAGTPAATLERIAAALAQVLDEPKVRGQLTDMGLTVGYQNAAQFGKTVDSYSRVWAGIIKASGFQPQ
jgi:tripartite-type tricarboxylate transporter receptor subunit TctC